MPTPNYQDELNKRREADERELDAVQKFFSFLRSGKPPGGITLGHKPRKMSAKQAFSLIYVLQEACHFISDRFELCSGCETIFDSEKEGTLIDKTGKHHCDSCRPD